MKSLTSNSIIEIAPSFRLQWEQAQQAHVFLYPEGMIRLNESTGAILSRCDGIQTVLSIIRDLQQQFPDADLEEDVREFLEEAHGRGWLRIKH